MYWPKEQHGPLPQDWSSVTKAEVEPKLLTRAEQVVEPLHIPEKARKGVTARMVNESSQGAGISICSMVSIQLDLTEDTVRQG